MLKTVKSSNAIYGDYIRIDASAGYKDCAQAILMAELAKKNMAQIRITKLTAEWSGFLGLGSGYMNIEEILDSAGKIIVSGYIYTTLEDGYEIDMSTGVRTNFKMCRLNTASCGRALFLSDGKALQLLNEGVACEGSGKHF